MFKYIEAIFFILFSLMLFVGVPYLLIEDDCGRAQWYLDRGYTIKHAILAYDLGLCK